MEASWADCAGPLAGALGTGVSAVVSDGAAMKPGRRLCIALPRDANLAPHPLHHGRVMGHNRTSGASISTGNKNGSDVTSANNIRDND